MCQSFRFIYNRYNRRKVLVSCGKCPACRQEKANKRTSRIKNNFSSGSIALFVTLTYTNDYIPYISKEQLLSDDLDVKVYRDAECRYTFSRYAGYKFVKSVGTRCIGSTFLQPYERTVSAVNSLSHLKGGSSDKVSVCFLPDAQNFIKRLRQVLIRNYEIKNKFTYFLASEYGSYTKRAHMHLLLFVPTCYEAQFRKAILAAWPYADSSRTEKYIEVARNAASYVSSYVNGSLSLPACLQASMFKSKHTFSHGFGTFLDCFSLNSILQKIDSGSLYYYSKQTFDGNTSFVNLSIPEYVLNRYFPKHKGFGRFTSSQLFDILCKPETISNYQDPIKTSVLNVDEKCFFVTNNVGFKFFNPLYHYTPKEAYRIYVSLENAYQRFFAVTGLSRIDYALYYQKAWSLRFSQILRDSFDGIEDFSNFYENAVEYVNSPSSAPTLDFSLMELNPNNLPFLFEQHVNNIMLFDKYDKSRKITNLVHSFNDSNV